MIEAGREYHVDIVDMIPVPLFTWDSQACQYAQKGRAGIHLEQHMLDLDTHEEVFGAAALRGGVTVIDCLLHRDEAGDLDGILNHYDGKNPLEGRDAVNVWVRPDRQRQGIATALITEAKARWPEVTYDKQRYSPAGVKLLKGLLRKASRPATE